MVVPTGKSVFGSAAAIVHTDSFGGGCSTHSSKKFSQVLYITKTHLKSLDQPNHRCSPENININTSACIARFIEKQLKCNAMILGSQYRTALDKNLLNFSSYPLEPEDGASRASLYERHACYFKTPGFRSAS